MHSKNGSHRFSLADAGALGVAAAAICFGLVHGTLRFIASPTLGQDDVIAAVFAQDWAWGYAPSNPPLYDWLLALLHEFTGPTLLSALVLRYGLLTATAVFTYLAALRVMGDRGWAALTALSLSLCYQIGWNIHEGVTQTSVLATLVAATLWIYLRLIDRGKLVDYAALGLCLGLGVLAKYNYPALVLTLLVASAFVPAARRRLADPRILLSLAIAAAIAAPFLAWLAAFSSDAIATRLPGEGARYLPRLARGLFNVVKSPVGFLTPFLFVVPLIFPGVVQRLVSAVRTFGAEGLAGDHERLLFYQCAASFGLLFAAAILGFDQAASRYMHPLFLPAVVLLMALAKDTLPQAQQVRRYVMALAGFAALVLLFRVTLLAVGPPICGPCHQLERFEALADALKNAGFPANGVVVTDNRFVAGNMRRLLPESTVALVGRREYLPRGLAERPLPAVAVISVGKGTEQSARALLGSAHLEGLAAERPRIFTAASDWTGHLWKPDGYRTSRWTIAVYPSGAARN
jgi:hypothetical protein